MKFSLFPARSIPPAFCLTILIASLQAGTGVYAENAGPPLPAMPLATETIAFASPAPLPKAPSQKISNAAPLPPTPTEFVAQAVEPPEASQNAVQYQTPPADASAPSSQVETPSTPAMTSSETLTETTAPEPAGKLQVQSTDPDSGETVNIHINSESLSYDPGSGIYTATGEVYIIIPEKNTELLADKVVFNEKADDMVATGNVFIIRDGNVIGSKKARYDFNKEISYFTKPRTMSENFKIQSEYGVRTDQYMILEDGRLLVDENALKRYSRRFQRRGVRLGNGAVYATYSANFQRRFTTGAIGRLAFIDPTLLDAMGYNMFEDEELTSPEAQIVDKPISPKDVAAIDFDPDNDLYHTHSNEINIYRALDGFDEIKLEGTTFRYNDVPVFYAPRLDFGYSETDGFMSYLGPRIGYNLDYGGVYAGPGFDFRVHNGWLKLSPIVSYGGGRRLRVSSSRLNPDITPKPGMGLIANYRSANNRTEFGYNSTVREPIFLMEHRINGQSENRIRLGYNQFYNNGFFNIERPNIIAEYVHLDSKRFNDKLLVRTYTTAGIARDEFFPTRESRYFVAPNVLTPVTTARVQFQAQAITPQPLFYLGNFGAVGAIAQTRLSGYGTGDFYGIAQGGPYLTLLAGPFYSQTRYLYGTVFGESPFVFDTYFRGRNYVQTVNSIDLGKYLTLGTFLGFNLNRDNARNDLLVDNRVFLSTGSKNVKFSLAFDLIQKRTFFGIMINPESSQIVMDFNTLNLFQPGYEPDRHFPPPEVVAPKYKPKKDKENDAKDEPKPEQETPEQS